MSTGLRDAVDRLKNHWDAEDSNHADEVLLAMCYLAVENSLGGCVVQADDGTTMFTVKLPSAPDGPRPYVNTLAEFRAALALAMAERKS